MLGGHLVTGHVDGIAQVRQVAEVAGSLRATIEAPAELARFIARKGSVTLDGVSLTVGEVSGATFVIDIVPHTRAVTTLGPHWPAGHSLNLEVDLVARYLDRLLEARGHPMNTIDELLDELRAGRMVVVMDDEERENEGDLIMAAAARASGGHQLHGAARPRAHLPHADSGALPRAPAALDGQGIRGSPGHELHGQHRGGAGRHDRHLRAGSCPHGAHRGRGRGAPRRPAGSPGTSFH